MAAEGRKEGLYDLSNVVAFGHNKQWLPKGAAKVSTKLAAKISPNGNTGRQLAPAAAALALRCLLGGRMALGWSSGCSLSEDEDVTNGPV